jgi:hypothetical protein
VAKPIGSLKLSLDEVSQTINLSKEAGIDLSDDPVLVNEIGQEIIDFMVDRAKDGRGLGGVKLKSPYSKAYSESLEFKAHDKNKNEVNMTLTGDMLGSIDLIENDPDKLKIAIAEDDEVPKAYNHNVGDTVPKRPFFGVDKSELENILANYESEFKALKDDKEETKRRVREGVAQRSLINIARGLVFDEDDSV